MSPQNNLTQWQHQEMVVAVFDLTSFTRYVSTHSDEEVIPLIAAYYEFVGEIIATGNGRVVKFMGDAGLMVFPAADADRAVQCLLQLKTEGDAWLAKRNIPSTNIIKAHVGKVYAGLFGTRTDKWYDVHGQTLITTFKLTSHGVALTAELFRKLKPPTRKAFKKHTPPITYIPVKERHQ